MDDIRRQLHNEQVMAEMKKIENDVKVSTADIDPKTTNTPAASEVDDSKPDSNPP